MARIARLGEADTEAYRAAIDSVARERRHLAMFEAPPLEDVRRYVQECVAKGRPQFAAFVDDELVGWCDITEKAREALRHVGMLGMGVLAEHRGRGIGRALLKATLEDAKAKGFRRVELVVRVDNAAAKRLYEHCGFVVEGTCRRLMRVDEKYLDAYLMAVLYD